ncbi:MAG: hypothetical protein KW793_00470 [Candidatus Doudnabacteria bacterium]|nr:hypothetical protein [Candidatus Doudnabacteria bacterium]
MLETVAYLTELEARVMDQMPVRHLCYALELFLQAMYSLRAKSEMYWQSKEGHKIPYLEKARPDRYTERYVWPVRTDDKPILRNFRRLGFDPSNEIEHAQAVSVAVGCYLQGLEYYKLGYKLVRDEVMFKFLFWEKTRTIPVASRYEEVSGIV